MIDTCSGISQCGNVAVLARMKSQVVVVWVFVVHLAGLYLFTRGFLLTRLSLSESSLDAPSLNPTHKRAVLFIIDALRFDFITPSPPSPSSPYHHNVLRLPYELSQSHPDRSLIFHSFVDPPTTTLQRIKALTTGSLPTFIDMGSNFGGSSVDEDSFIKQLRLNGKRVRDFVVIQIRLKQYSRLRSWVMTLGYQSFRILLNKI
jgi:GPI ethanolamine phosphate transferase 3 subunit O